LSAEEAFSLSSAALHFVAAAFTLSFTDSFSAAVAFSLFIEAYS